MIRDDADIKKQEDYVVLVIRFEHGRTRSSIHCHILNNMFLQILNKILTFSYTFNTLANNILLYK